MTSQEELGFTFTSQLLQVAKSQLEAMKRVHSFNRVNQGNYKIRRAPALGLSDRELEKFVPQSAWKLCPGAAGTEKGFSTKSQKVSL